MPDPDRTRRRIGLAMLILGCLSGGAVLLVLFVLEPLLTPNGGKELLSMIIGGALAFPAMLVYLTVPRLLDRYDPEPWYALIGCVLWGAIAACGYSGVVNTVNSHVFASMFGPDAARIMGPTISAPLVEELYKGLGVWGVYFWLRREFDGVVDGIIYATFVAIGFAAVENVIYYQRALSGDGAGQLILVFVMRGVLAPWGHPLYTAMTGIGIGMARETTKTWVRWTAPFIGYCGAVFLHFVWNGSAVLGEAMGSGAFFLLSLLLWFVFVAAFLIIVIVLVRRRGKIIREHLQDEVAMRNLSPEEVELVCSPFGLLRARSRYGSTGVEFVRATARLALSKWHTMRAHRGHNKTMSADFIGPLRMRIAELRREMT